MANKRNKSGDTVPIGEVLDGLMGSLGSSSAPELVRIWRLWHQIVGEAVAQNTKPAAFKGKILLVYVSSSVWTHQLQFLKEEMIRNINAELGHQSVEDIKFKIGPVQ